MIIAFIIVYNFNYKGGHNLSSNPYLRVEFNEQIVLYWDPIFSRFIENDLFFAILNDPYNIPLMASFITDEEIVDSFVCSKKRTLKKGDIAFLFLARHRRGLTHFNCLGRQIDRMKLDLDMDSIEFIDWVESNCKLLPVLLDLIEKDRDLFSKRILSCIDEIFRHGSIFSKDTSKKEILRKIRQDTILNKIRQDIIKVGFGEQFALYWDGINHEIIKNESYFALLENKDNIRLMSHFIANEEIVYDFICNKENALKKGDIAFIFLIDHGLLHNCKPPILRKIPFNSYRLYCQYPEGIFNHVERNRKLISQIAISCLDGADIPQVLMDKQFFTLFRNRRRE